MGGDWSPIPVRIPRDPLTQNAMLKRFYQRVIQCLTMQAKSKLKRWGNSFGVVVPKDIVEKEGLKEGEEVEISVRKGL